jgi:hypothetical protein
MTTTTTGDTMRKLLIVAAVVAGFTVGGLALAEAAIPDAQGVIHACRHNNTGALRVIDSETGRTCGSNETPLNWNQVGPQGPAGPPGPAGSTGYEVVRAPVPVLPPDTDPDAPPEFTRISCPSGKYGVEMYLTGSSPNGSHAGGLATWVLDEIGRITAADFRRLAALPYTGAVVCVNA